MTWLPISSAPTDGTVIDLWVSYHDGSGKRVPDAYWSTEGTDFGPARCDGKGGGMAANMGYDGCDGYADDPEDCEIATHWMPTPGAPKPTGHILEWLATERQGSPLLDRWVTDIEKLDVTQRRLQLQIWRLLADHEYDETHDAKIYAEQLHWLDLLQGAYL